MKIYNLLEKPKFIKEYFYLCSKEWGDSYKKNKFNIILKKKEQDFLNGKMKNIIIVLILIDNDNLIGFISLFENDDCKFLNLSPWYATMYVKEKYRKKGYSKILNDAIIQKAKQLGYEKLYLKTVLNNYYEKFGAKYLENINDFEKLYCININK